jgi:hypothetical protein
MLSQQEISDRLEIAQVIQRYGLALDEKDYQALDRVFHPEAMLHYKMSGREVQAPASEWKERFAEFLKPFVWTSHSFSEPVIELEGATATARCRLIAVHLQENLEGDRSLWIVHGFYRDLLVRGDTGWRIRERHFTGVYTEGEMLPRGQAKLFPELPREFRD